jgi:hypothetical protein
MPATTTVDRVGARRAEEALRAVLPRAASVRKATKDAEADLIVGDVPLRLEWVGEGRLGNVRRALARGRRPDVVVARVMSAGARDALSEAGVGWVDETGAAEIAVGAVIVSRTGRPQPPVEKPPRWTPAVLAVAEALLCGTPGTVAATEEATGLSTGSCTSALRALTDLGLLVAEASRGRGSARRIADPDQFLDHYASAAFAMREDAGLQVGVTWRDVIEGLAEIGKKWDKQGVAWAATGAAAASVLAPYLTSISTAEVYVDTDSVLGLEAVARAAGLRPIDGGRVTIRPFPTVTTRRLANEADGLRVAPWPRVYADLREAGVRGEEAAEHLREVIRGD